MEGSGIETFLKGIVPLSRLTVVFYPTPTPQKFCQVCLVSLRNFVAKRKSIYTNMSHERHVKLKNEFDCF